MSRRRAGVIAMILTALLVGEIFRVGFAKNLVATIGNEEWGRHLFGFAAALTQSIWGIGGYVVDAALDDQLSATD